MQIVAVDLLDRAKFNFVAKVQLFLAFNSAVIPPRFDQASRSIGTGPSRFAGLNRGYKGPCQQGTS